MIRTRIFRLVELNFRLKDDSANRMLNTLATCTKQEINSIASSRGLATDGKTKTDMIVELLNLDNMLEIGVRK